MLVGCSFHPSKGEMLPRLSNSLTGYEFLLRFSVEEKILLCDLLARILIYLLICSLIYLLTYLPVPSYHLTFYFREEINPNSFIPFYMLSLRQVFTQYTFTITPS